MKQIKITGFLTRDFSVAQIFSLYQKSVALRPQHTDLENEGLKPGYVMN